MRTTPRATIFTVLLALGLPVTAQAKLPGGAWLFGQGRPQVDDPLQTQRWRVGDKPSPTTVVFLHGLGCDARDPLLTRLIGKFQASGENLSVVSPWLRPVKLGELGKIVPAGSHTMTDQLARARKVIESQPGKVVLMGHSFGGKAAFQLAQEYPDKVSCVIGLAPSVNMLYSYWKELSGERGLSAPAQMNARMNQHRDALGRALQKVEGDTSLKGKQQTAAIHGELSYLAKMQDLVAFNEAAVESSVKTPTLVLQGVLDGRTDGAVSIHYIRRFLENNQAPGARLEEQRGLIAGKPGGLSVRTVRRFAPGQRGVVLKEYEGVDHGFMVPTGPKLVDLPLTDRVTEDMAREISGFIRQHAMGVNR